MPSDQDGASEPSVGDIIKDIIGRGTPLSPQELEIHALRSRIANLEGQLADYHQWLESSLRHDRKFLLGATWGILNGGASLGAALAAYWIAGKTVGHDGWISGIIMAIVFVVVLGMATHSNEKWRSEDEGKLSRLPSWEDVKNRY